MFAGTAVEQEQKENSSRFLQATKNLQHFPADISSEMNYQGRMVPRFWIIPDVLDTSMEHVDGSSNLGSSSPWAFAVTEIVPEVDCQAESGADVDRCFRCNSKLSIYEIDKFFKKIRE